MRPSKQKERPRVLGVRTGCSPASGGLGVEVTWLLLGGGGLVAATLVVAALLRGKKPEQIGEPRKEHREDPP